MKAMFRATRIGRVILRYRLDDLLEGTVAERWLRTMTQIFPDVKAGDRITGIQRPEGLSRFFHNSSLRGEVRDAEFTRRFFGIWLGETTSEPSLRDSLLGQR